MRLDRRAPGATGRRRRDRVDEAADDQGPGRAGRGLLPRRRRAARDCSPTPGAASGAARRHRPGRPLLHRRGPDGRTVHRSGRCGCRPASPSSTRRRGTASPSTPPAAATAPATSARCGSSAADARSPGTTCRTFSREQLDDGWRLACLVQATRDLEVDVPPLTTRPKAATVGVGRQVILRPAVQKRYVELDRADPRRPAHRPRPAARRDRRPRATADLHVLRRLPDGAARGRLQGHRGRRRRGADRRRARRHHRPVRYAIAFDLGTTTVVATLLDLVTGTPVAVASMLNKQQPFGGDVITRISATMMDPDALGRLQAAAGETLRRAGRPGLRARAASTRAHVYEVAIAGNATMTALVLGIDPEPLGVAPFVMSTSQPPDGARPPSSASPCTRGPGRACSRRSAPTSAATSSPACSPPGMDRDKRTRLFIDVGTNCEIVLSDGDTHPRHRGAGRPGVRGRRDPVRHARRRRRDRGHQARPGGRRRSSSASSATSSRKGLCGSGLVDAVAELVRVGLLDATGRFVPEEDAATSRPSSPTG